MDSRGQRLPDLARLPVARRAGRKQGRSARAGPWLTAETPETVGSDGPGAARRRFRRLHTLPQLLFAVLSNERAKASASSNCDGRRGHGPLAPCVAPRARGGGDPEELMLLIPRP